MPYIKIFWAEIFQIRQLAGESKLELVAEQEQRADPEFPLRFVVRELDCLRLHAPKHQDVS